jgi:hypothetical protein
VVEAGGGEGPGDLQAAARVGAAGGHLADVVGGDERGRGLEVDRFDSSACTFQPVGPKRIRSCADLTAVASSGAQASGTSPKRGPLPPASR